MWCKITQIEQVFNYKTCSKVPPFLSIVDIAGLVKGASEGQGLGNAFLSHVYACDALFHLCSEIFFCGCSHYEGCYWDKCGCRVHESRLTMLVRKKIVFFFFKNSEQVLPWFVCFETKTLAITE